MGNARSRRFQADGFHGLVEKLPVFRLVDGIAARADKLRAEALEHPFPGQIEGAIQRRLPAHGGQERVRALPLDDLGHRRPVHGLDVGGIGHGGIGHDGSRIGIHQDDPVALFPERFASLGSGVIEFTGLADHYRAGTEDQNAFDIGTLWHGPRLPLPGALRS